MNDKLTKSQFESLSKVLDGLYKIKHRAEEQIWALYDIMHLNNIINDGGVQGTNMYDFRCTKCGNTWMAADLLPCDKCNGIME